MLHLYKCPMDVSFLVFTVTLQSSYPFFSPCTSSPLLTAHTLPTLLRCLCKTCPASTGLINLSTSCVFHSTYYPLHEITWCRAKCTGLGVRGPEFKFWLHHLIALWPWVSHFSCWHSVSLVIRVVRETDEMRATECPDGAQCWLWQEASHVTLAVSFCLSAP